MPTPYKTLSNLGLVNLRSMVNFILWLVLLITVIAVFVPFSPVMPAAGLDRSWVFGMNQAIAQELSFGKEIIFSFGPYSSIYTRGYHPATGFMMISGSLYLALSYWACLFFLSRNVQWRWVLSIYTVLAGFLLMYFRDTLLFSLPLLVGLLIFKNLFSKEGMLVKSKLAPFYIASLFAPFGLLPLIKGSILILCVAVTVLSSAFFIANKHRLLAIISLSTPMVSTLIFWVASGQSVATFPGYFINMARIIFGFTEAMAVGGNICEVILYLIASAFLLFALSIQKQGTCSSKTFLFCVYFAFLFLSFKAGFVRHDAHAVISGISILIAAILLPFVIKSRMNLPIIAIALFAWLIIDGNYIKTSTESVTNNVISTYSSMWHGIQKRIGNRNWPGLEFDAAVNSLRKQASFPVLQGTTDIYSYNQSYLISSGSYWSPRPIFQSYSAYTPSLAEKNRRHLLGAQAPDNVIFKVETIDKRFPSMDDGASWPIMMLNYRPTRMENDFLFLQKKENIIDIEEQLKLPSEIHAFGESVLLPYSREPVFAQIEIKPTIWGHIASFLFKSSQLRVILDLNNGMKKEFRIIASMVKSGFVISPLIENTTEFAMLYANKGFLYDKLVKSITIAPRNGRSLFWRTEYTVCFSEIQTGPPTDISGIYKLDQFADELSNYEVITADKCDGSIDRVNGISPAPAKLFASNLLQVNGWAAASVDMATLPEAVYIVLTDGQGNHKYIKTHQTARPDVGAYFKKAELNDSGYSTTADISALEGQYILGLAIRESNKIRICPQFKIQLTITK